MKPTQTVLLLVIVVVMIFAVTFASMFLRDKDPGSKPGTELVPNEKKKGGKEVANLQLTFPITRHPDSLADVNLRLVSEYGRFNQHDFWFFNDNDGEVTIGLNSKNCTCTDVSVYLTPREWHATLAGGTGRTLALTAMTPLAALADLTRQDQELRDKASEVDQKKLQVLDPDRGFTVPARTGGFVRMRWEGKRTGYGAKPEVLTSQLWTTNQKSGAAVTLQVATLLVDPIMVEQPEVEVGVMGPEDTRQAVVRCWSALHPRFDLKSTVTGAPFVSAGPPQPMPEADLAKLRERHGVVMGGYLIPVVVRESVDGGKKQMDIGPFVHHVTITPSLKDKPLDPITVAVTGEVQGEVKIVGGRSGINLGTYSAKVGTSQTVVVTTDRTDLELQIERVPGFLKARLDKNEEATRNEGRPHWNLTIDVEPNMTSGKFPRPDHPAFRDSNIVLKTGGRGMRIPVHGEAKQ